MDKPASSRFSMPVWVLVFGFILFGPLMAMGPRFTPGIIVYGTVALLPLMFQNWRQAKEFYFRPAMALLLAALIYSCASVLWSPSARAADMAIDISYLAICGMLLAGEFHFAPPDKKPGFLLFFSSSLVAGFAFLLIEIVFDHPIHRWFNGIPAAAALSSTVDKRLISLFSLGIWPLAAWLDQARARRWAIGSIAAFLCLAASSSSRTSALGLVAGIAVTVLAGYWPVLMRWVLMGAITCGLVFVLPAMYLLGQLPQNVTEEFFSSAQHRIAIWKLTVPEVLQSPVFGHGIDAARGLKTEVPPGSPFMAAGETVISQHPHNIFLQLWLDFGAVGVLLWGALMLLLAHSIRVLPRNVQAYALGAGFCSLAMLSTSYSPLQAWWLAMHITTALILALVAQCPSTDIVKTNEDFLKAVRLKLSRLNRPR